MQNKRAAEKGSEKRTFSGGRNCKGKTSMGLRDGFELTGWGQGKRRKEAGQRTLLEHLEKYHSSRVKDQKDQKGASLPLKLFAKDLTKEVQHDRDPLFSGEKKAH